MFGSEVTCVIGAKSRSASYRHLFVDHRVGGERRYRHQQGVTIRRGLRHDITAYQRSSARSIVDDDLLTQTFTEFWRDDACNNIRSAACTGRNDHANRARRIAGLRETVLCRRDAQQAREQHAICKLVRHTQAQFTVWPYACRTSAAVSTMMRPIIRQRKETEHGL